MKTKYPQINTMDEAVTIVLDGMGDDDKVSLANYKEEDLITHHLDLGMQIRNYFGLWYSNKEFEALIESEDPDDTSMQIIVAVWKKLNNL